MVTTDGLLRDLNAWLASSTPQERAALVEEMVQAVYAHVKQHVSAGARPGGFDRADTPEREAFGQVSNLVRSYVDELGIMAAGLRSGPPEDSDDSLMQRLAREVHRANNRPAPPDR